MKIKLCEWVEQKKKKSWAKHKTFFSPTNFIAHYAILQKNHIQVCNKSTTDHNSNETPPRWEPSKTEHEGNRGSDVAHGTKHKQQLQA